MEKPISVASSPRKTVQALNEYLFGDSLLRSLATSPVASAAGEVNFVASLERAAPIVHRLISVVPTLAELVSALS